MKRIISRILLLTMVFSLLLPIANHVYAKENIGIVINDAYINDDYIEMAEERLYVSARSVANPMGLNLEWNDFNKTLLLSNKSTMITLMVASNLAIVNNNAYETEQPLKIVSDLAIIDLGFVCDVLEAPMTFNESENAYYINIDVAEDFQPDVDKFPELSNTVSLFSNTLPELTKATEVASAFELEIMWDDSIKGLTFTSVYGDALVLYPENTTAWFNGDSIDCPNPMKIIDDQAYVEYEFVEDLFTVQVPHDFTPVREIADALNLEVSWNDGTKTVTFVDENGVILEMSVGSCFYKINNKFYDNDAPLMIKDDVAMTELAVIEDAFLNHSSAEAEEEVELMATTQTFSGNIILEKTLNYRTYIDINVISVQSIAYNNNSGLTYNDYNTKRISIPANSNTASFSVTKTNCSSYDRYIIGYSFPYTSYTSDYYYDYGYLSYDNDIITYLSSYVGNYKSFYLGGDTTDITIKPKTYSYVTLDDAVFSGVISTRNGTDFGAGSTVKVSVRSNTYYGESTLSSVTLYPGNTSSVDFSVPVTNDSSTRNTSLYLCYEYRGTNGYIMSKGYYKDPLSTVNERSQAKAWSLKYDNLSDINFIANTLSDRTVSGDIWLRTGYPNKAKNDISISVDIMSVRSSVYSDSIIYQYASFDNVATIKQGENFANYSVSALLEDGATYIFKYRIETPDQGLFPYGYSTSGGVNNTIVENATRYLGDDDLSQVDFELYEGAKNNYNYINNLPYIDIEGNISPSSDNTSRGTYYTGYYVYLTGGQRISVELKSVSFDAYLILLDDEMNMITYNDDGLSHRNSIITPYISETGYYYIQATTCYPGDTGKYSIKISTDKEISGSTTFTDLDGNALSSIGDNRYIKAYYNIENNGAESKDCYLVMSFYDTADRYLGNTKTVVPVDDILEGEPLILDIGGFDNVGSIKSFIWTDTLDIISNVDYLYK